jgi:hypothetical protein
MRAWEATKRLNAIKRLEAIIDHALLEGADLKIPLLVFLLRKARDALRDFADEQNGSAD